MNTNFLNLRALISVAALIFFIALIWEFKPAVIPADIKGAHYGLWSLLPAIVTISICFITRNVLLALLLGVIIGSLVASKANVINDFLIPSLGSTGYAEILLVYLWALGSLLGLWNRNGGTRYFAKTIANRFIRSRTTAKMFAWIMGVIFHQGGTMSTVLTGTTVRNVSDQHKVSREELAYMVDSTASPIATLIPFNAWPIYIAGLIEMAGLFAILPIIASTEDAVLMFYKAIPFNFYAIFAITMTFLFALDRLPLFGTPMQKAVERVKTTGELTAPGDTPMLTPELTEDKVAEGYRSGMEDFLAPLGTLFAFCLVPLAYGQGPWVFEGFAMSVVVALVLSLLKGMSISEAFDAIITGVKGMSLGAIVLGLAVTLAAVSKALGTSFYVVEVGGQLLETVPFVLPALLLLICMLISFAIGTSWGTYAVIFPAALPLAFALSPNESFALLTFGAILGGSVFGDQCSPISDTTILSSVATGSDLMAHVNTQFPLAMIAAGSGGVLYLILGFIFV